MSAELRPQKRYGVWGYVGASGVWHSARWWDNHHETRDRCGEYGAAEGAECSANHNHGWRTSRRGREAMNRRRGGEREQLRENARLAQHAQEGRAEAYSRGYKRERAAFYGSGKEAAAEGGEAKINTTDFDREWREYSRQQRESHWFTRERGKKRRRRTAAA